MTSIQIYCDTDTLLNNIARHSPLEELQALQRLLDLRLSGRISMVRSRVALRELENTKEQNQLQKLRVDYTALEQIKLDERVHGFHQQTELGIVAPLVSDVQDEKLRDELQRQGFAKRDAEHLTQAACNGCDVFLTRDSGIICERKWLEERFPKLRVRRPSEIAQELDATS